MKTILRTLLTLCCLAGITTAYGQDTYVSKPIVDAMNAGKYCMKLEGISRDEGEMRATPISLEMATRGDAVFMRSTAMAMENVMLSSDGNTFMLDEHNKTWTYMQGAPMQRAVGRLSFNRQYKCTVSGNPDWYCDEYRSTTGETVRFYYNQNKVSIVDLGGENAVGPMHLITFSSVIPEDMYFCLDKSWKQGGSSTDAAIAAAGVDMDAIQKQIMDELDDADLPPGMTKADMMKMIQSRMGGVMKGAGGKGAGAKGGKPSGPTPPSCSTPWHDTGTVTNIACGTNTGAVTVSGMQAVSSPVYASSFESASEDNGERFAITEAGVTRALTDIRNTIENMSDEEALNYVFRRSNDIMVEIAGETANGETLEEAIATCIAFPTALSLNNTGSLFLMKDDSKTALDYFKAALDMDPDNAIILTNVAECYLDMDNIAEARRYAEKALQQSPDFGSAQQMMATCCFRANDNLKGWNWLLKSAEHHFSNITAQQMFYVYTLIEEERMQCLVRDNHEVFQKIYSTENLELLRKLIMNGGEYNHQGVSFVDKAYYPWPVYNASRAALFKKKHRALDKLCSEWSAQIDKAETNPKSNIPLYTLMGTTNIAYSADALHRFAAEIIEKKSAKYAGEYLERASQIKLPDSDQLMDAYRALSKQMAEGKDANMITDARQMWALLMYRQYNDIQLNYAAGKLTTEDKDGNLVGTYPKEYATYHQKDRQIEAGLRGAEQVYVQREKNALEKFQMELDKASKVLQSGTRHCDLKARKIEYAGQKVYYKESLEAMKYYISSLEKIAADRLNAYKTLYTTSIQPAMEHYYSRTWKGTSVCQDQNVANWFMYVMLVDNAEYTGYCFDKAVECGEMVKALKDLYKQRAEEYGEAIEYVEEKIQENDQAIYEAMMTPPEVQVENLPISEFFFGADFVIGKVEYIFTRDGKFSVSFTNNYTNREHRFNLSDATYTATQVYPVMTDEERKGRTDAEILRMNVGADALIKLQGHIPGVVGIAEKAADLVQAGQTLQKFGSCETSNLRSISMDAAGNRQEIVSGVRKEHNFQVMGNGLTIGKDVYYAGGVKKVRNHAKLTSGNFFGGVR